MSPTNFNWTILMGSMSKPKTLTENFCYIGCHTVQGISEIKHLPITPGNKQILGNTEAMWAP